MSQIDIQDLFDISRFPSGWSHISLFLYTPVGLLLVLVRSLAALQLWLLASLLPDFNGLRVFLNHGLSFVFGILVQTESETEESNNESRIIVANNVSVLDHFALYKVTHALSPSIWKLPTALNNSMGLQEMDMSNKDALIANIKQFLSTSKCKVALQPEFGTTNGRVALLKFNSWPFSIEPLVQPVAIKAWRPEFLSVHLTSLGSRWWIDVFWFMFVPYTVFTLKYLKSKRNTEYEVLVRDVEKDIATSLGLQTSSHTVSDKAEFEKRCIMEKTNNRRFNRRSSPNSQVHNIELQRMVRQVREVLPLVPQNVILRDLLKTRNVDITIANILDGIVTYTPEPSPSPVTPSTSTNRTQNSIVKNFNVLGSSSIQERKAKMIQEARERYIKKHGLKNC